MLYPLSYKGVMVAVFPDCRGRIIAVCGDVSNDDGKLSSKYLKQTAVNLKIQLNRREIQMVTCH